MIHLLLFLTVILVPLVFLFLMVFTLVVWYLRYVGFRLWYMGSRWRMGALREHTRYIIADVVGCLNALWWWLGVVGLFFYHMESVAVYGNGYGGDRQSFLWGLGDFVDIPEWYVFFFPFGFEYTAFVGVLILVGKLGVLWLRRYYGEGNDIDWSGS